MVQVHRGVNMYGLGVKGRSRGSGVVGVRAG